MEEQLDDGPNQRRSRLTISRLTVSPAEGAELLGVSRDFFDEHIRPELRVIRKGRLILIPVKELERWVDENATVTVSFDELWRR